MMFAKRHYETVALALQRAHPQEGCANGSARDRAVAVVQWDYTMQRLADAFARDSRAFQRERFLRACLPGNNVRARRVPCE